MEEIVSRYWAMSENSSILFLGGGFKGVNIEVIKWIFVIIMTFLNVMYADARKVLVVYIK